MLTQQKLMVSLALVLFTVPVSADSLVYVVGRQFGAVDLATGAFQQIGPDLLNGETGLVPGPNGTLLSLAFSGELNSINPATGATRVVGPTGLADCATPMSPCGPTSANTLGELAGMVFATDIHNNLYKVNPLTGVATLIGPTGIPAIPFIPTTTNPDGSFNFYDEGLFGAGGKLYATFNTGTINPVTGMITHVIAPNLYQIDPTTGLTTLVAPTTFSLGAVADVNGTLYAFENDTHQVVTLDLTNGKTSVVTNFDPAVGIVAGASPVTPEPASFALAGIGIAAIVGFRRRRRSLSD